MKRFGKKVIGDWQKDFIFASPMTYMVAVAQLARALVCGTKGRGFETHQPPSAGLSAKSEGSVSFTLHNNKEKQPKGCMIQIICLALPPRGCEL